MNDQSLEQSSDLPYTTKWAWIISGLLFLLLGSLPVLLLELFNAITITAFVRGVTNAEHYASLAILGLSVLGLGTIVLVAFSFFLKRDFSNTTSKLLNSLEVLLISICLLLVTGLHGELGVYLIVFGSPVLGPAIAVGTGRRSAILMQNGYVYWLFLALVALVSVSITFSIIGALSCGLGGEPDFCEDYVKRYL